MRARLPALLLLALLSLALPAALPARASAQDPFDDPDTEVVAPVPAVADPTPEAAEPDGDAGPTGPTGPGADADADADAGADDVYDACRSPDAIYGADADYVYCVPSAAGGGDKSGPEIRRAPETAAAAPLAAARALPADRLPLTGSEPLVVLLLGGGLALGGAGLRIVSAPR